jgi:hypothetical protein
MVWGFIVPPDGCVAGLILFVFEVPLTNPGWECVKLLVLPKRVNQNIYGTGVAEWARVLQVPISSIAGGAAKREPLLTYADRYCTRLFPTSVRGEFSTLLVDRQKAEAMRKRTESEGSPSHTPRVVQRVHSVSARCCTVQDKLSKQKEDLHV